MSRPRFALFTTLGLGFLLVQSAHAGINFVGAELTNVAPQPEHIAVGDFNGDQRADVVVVSPASREVTTFLASDTPSHFAPAQTLRIGEKPVNVAIGDLNADGRLDLVVPDEATRSFWLVLGRGDGTFLPQIQVVVAQSRKLSAAAIANFDDIGNNDIAVADERLGRIFILRNDNQNPPGFLRGGEIEVGEKPEVIRNVDLNGDGKPDILTVNFGGPRVKELTVSLWRRAIEGFPEFEPIQRYTIGEKPEKGLVIADFNDDGVQDAALLNRAIEARGNSEVELLLGSGNGRLLSPMSFPVPCPFFTGGQPCRAYNLAAGDFDHNNTVDLAITIADPRRARGSASMEADALQIFSGRGDGTFLSGGLYSTQKVPVSIAATDLTGDGFVDLAVANQRTLDLQAFVNVSTPGELGNGELCELGEECVSSRCTNGVCCAAQCDTEFNELCNIPMREGTCVPVLEPIECTEPDPGCPVDRIFCTDGFCCDEECFGGRCDVLGLEGVCIPGIPDGEPCNGDDLECASEHCSDNFICCFEDCSGGFCQAGTGVCYELLPLASECEFNEQCESNVCDFYDLICCNRVCDEVDEKCFPEDGICHPFDYTPLPATVTPTPTPRPTPAANGETCGEGPDCNSGNCVNNICCVTSSCDPDQHCQAGTGNCVGGPPPTPTAEPTRQPTLPTPDPCGGCPQGYRCVGDLCVVSSSGGGCSTGGDDSARGNLILASLLPFAVWMGRRWQLQRARARA